MLVDIIYTVDNIQFTWGIMLMGVCGFRVIGVWGWNPIGLGGPSSGPCINMASEGAAGKVASKLEAISAGVALSTSALSTAAILAREYNWEASTAGF